MQSHTKVIEFPKSHSEEADPGPLLVAWRYDCGGLAIMIEGWDDLTNGQIFACFSPEVGVQIGAPTILALSGEPSLLLCKGDFEDHRELFRKWDMLAEENDRLAIFEEEGLAGLARLPKLHTPPLPEIDEERTARANAVTKIARARIAEAGKTRDLTLNDCVEIVAEVDAGWRRWAKWPALPQLGIALNDRIDPGAEHGFVYPRGLRR